MEIIFEVLFMLVGGIVRIVLEILAQAVFELLAEIGMRSLAEPFKPSGSSGDSCRSFSGALP